MVEITNPFEPVVIEPLPDSFRHEINNLRRDKNAPNGIPITSDQWEELCFRYDHWVSCDIGIKCERNPDARKASSITSKVRKAIKKSDETKDEKRRQLTDYVPIGSMRKTMLAWLLRFINGTGVKRTLQRDMLIVAILYHAREQVIANVEKDSLRAKSWNTEVHDRYVQYLKMNMTEQDRRRLQELTAKGIHDLTDYEVDEFYDLEWRKVEAPAITHGIRNLLNSEIGTLKRHYDMMPK